MVKGSIPDWLNGTLVYNGECLRCVPLVGFTQAEPLSTLVESCGRNLATVPSTTPTTHGSSSVCALLSCHMCLSGGGDYSHMRHMFDGYGFLSRLRVQDGRAWGNQRYVQSKAFQAYKAQGKALPESLTEPVCRSVLRPAQLSQQWHCIGHTRGRLSCCATNCSIGSLQILVCTLVCRAVYAMPCW